MASTSLRSSSVTLDNVDDYLAPSQACVNPAFQPSTKINEGDDNSNSKKDDDAKTSLKQESPVVGIVPRRRRRIVRKNVISTDEKSLSSSSSSSSSFPINPITNKKEEEQNKNKDVVKASMADCLACSGCVTTAETVMMEERHSLNSLRERLKSSSSSSSNGGGDRAFRVVTISPNSWADICRHWNLTTKQHQQTSQNLNDDDDDDDDDDDGNYYFSRFTTLLSKILYVNMVVDGNVPLQWTWIDEAKEFCQVYKENQEKINMAGNNNASSAVIEKNSPRLLPSMAIDSSKTLYYNSDGTSVTRDNSSRPTPNLPLISGSCPALVCLVEKTLTNLVPHLSQSISPMSMVGMILKDDDNDNSTNANNNDNNDKLNIDDDSMKKNKSTNWDHWAIMPCHDKKLEASRKDFIYSKEQVVDLVISTQECVELVEEWITSQQQQPMDQDQDQDQTQLKQLLTNRDIVVRYLESVSPSDVSTTILEPKDLLEKSSYATDQLPLLVTTPPLIARSDIITTTTAAAAVDTSPLQKQMSFSSGGHANFIFLYAVKKLFGCTLVLDQGGVNWKAASLAMKNVRSARLGKLMKQHYYEVKLYHHPDGSYSTDPFIVVGDGGGSTMSSSSESKQLSPPVLHFAIAHGMQTMQRALKQVAERSTTGNNSGNNSSGGGSSSSNSLHYLEAMAYVLLKSVVFWFCSISPTLSP
jgi:iron only hydrogenase large subunit-like protein